MIKFYRGNSEKYDLVDNKLDDIFFTNDTNEIIINNKLYGKNANSSIITEDILVEGGPLADYVKDKLPENWIDSNNNKIIPKGESIQTVFSKLLSKTINGTVSWGSKIWSPSLGDPTVTLSSNGPVEVGSTVTCTVTPNSTVSNNKRFCTCTASEGHFTSIDGNWIQGNKIVEVPGNESGTLAIAYTWNDDTVSNFVSNSTALKIKSGENKFVASQSGITASVDALPETIVYASTNTKQVLSNVSAKLTDTKPNDELLSSSNYDTITGYYRWNAFVADSINNITDTKSSWKFVNSKTVSSVTAANQKYIIIMIPSGYSLISAKQMGLDFIGSFTTEDVTLTIGGGSDIHDYKMYYWLNTTGSDAEVENITIS